MNVDNYFEELNADVFWSIADKTDLPLEPITKIIGRYCDTYAGTTHNYNVGLYVIENICTQGVMNKENFSNLIEMCPEFFSETNYMYVASHKNYKVDVEELAKLLGEQERE